MFGYEEELLDEIEELKAENEKLKAENEKLKLCLSVVIKSLPTNEDIEKEAMKHDAEYMSETFFEEGAKWIREMLPQFILVGIQELDGIINQLKSINQKQSNEIEEMGLGIFSTDFEIRNLINR